MFSIILFISVVSMVFMTTQYNSEARLLPQLVGGTLSILLLVDIVKQMKATKKGETQKSKTVLHPGFEKVLIAMPVYIVLVSILGFLLASAILIFGLPVWLGKREKTPIIVLGSIIWVVVFVMFDVILNVPFPQGILG